MDFIVGNARQSFLDGMGLDDDFTPADDGLGMFQFPVLQQGQNLPAAAQQAVQMANQLQAMLPGFSINPAAMVQSPTVRDAVQAQMQAEKEKQAMSALAKQYEALKAKWERQKNFVKWGAIGVAAGVAIFAAAKYLRRPAPSA